MIMREKTAQNLLQILHGLAFELAEILALQVDFQQFLLLADHVVVVEYPLVGSAYEALRFGLFDQEQVVIGDFLQAFLKVLICAFHNGGFQIRQR